MNFTFENQGTNTYLVYKVLDDDTIDTMSLGMLANNKIPGFAPTIFMQMDDSKYIKYNVSARISVREFFLGPVNKKRLLGVFNGIIEAMMSAEDYMIDVNSIIMDLEHIFTDVSTCETFLICLPLSNIENKSVDLGNFFKKIMFNTQFDQTENCDHVAKIMNYLNSTPIFTLNDFKTLLDSIKDDIVAQHPVQQKVQLTVQPIDAPIAQPAVMSNQEKSMIKSSETVAAVPSQPIVQTSVDKTVAQLANLPKKSPPKISSQSIQKKVPSSNPPTNIVNTENGGQKISMMYLLQHYNKENYAAYKAQKEERKAKKNQKTATTQPKNQQNVPFSMPGAKSVAISPNSAQANNSNFAIPGQPTFAQSKVAVTPQTVPAHRNAQPVAVQPIAPAIQQPVVTQTVKSPMQTAYLMFTQQKQSMNFGETTVLGGANAGETTVLNVNAQQNQKPIPYLIRSKNNEKILLNKPVFRVGKERSYVDYFVGDNTAVSRSHANFITREDEYFVVDTNSTNHTYVNGTMIQSNVEARLSHGDTVRLANEDFEFKLY